VAVAEEMTSFIFVELTRMASIANSAVLNLTRNRLTHLGIRN